MPAKSFYERKTLPNGVDHGSEVIFDQRRARTAWFEGQHVTADQFNRDQSYAITRMADMGRTIGRGVVEGLEVSSPKSTVLFVRQGLGLAASGEVIHLPVDITLDLADIPTQRRLNVQLKSKADISPRPETRTGLFVLGASIVEQSSNPIASYPVSLNSERKLQDSVINEAVLFTLTPVPVPITKLDENDWRAMAAYRIFIEEEEAEMPPGALPLAMVAMQANQVMWVDVPMVRRSLAANAGRDAGLGLVDESRRSAHYEQFDAVMQEYLTNQPGKGAPASDLVRAVPAMGRLPVACVARRADVSGPMRLSQNWLPAATPVELIALPEDEIKALLRESMHLPPIDLSDKDEVHANMPVSIIVPVPRANWMQTPAEVAEAAVPLKAPPAVGGTPTAPEDLLRELLDGVPVASPSDSLATQAWSTLLGQAEALWYVRRRQFQRSDLAMNGIVIPVVTPPIDGPVLPPVEPPVSVDLEPFIDAAFGPVRKTFGALKADDLVEVFFSGDADERLAIILHQLRLKDERAYSTMMAVAFDLNKGVIRPKDVFEKYDPNIPLRWLRFENAILGVEPLLNLLASDLDNDDGVIKFLRNRFGLSLANAQRVAKDGMPITMRIDDLDKPERLREILGELTEFNARYEFTVADPFSDKVNVARRRLAQCARLSEITFGLDAVPFNKMIDLVPELRAVFADASITKDALGEKLATLISAVT